MPTEEPAPMTSERLEQMRELARELDASAALAAEVKRLNIDSQKLVEMTELRDRAEMRELTARRDAAVAASERASENVAALTAARAHLDRSLAVALLACAVCLGSGIAIGLGL